MQKAKGDAPMAGWPWISRTSSATRETRRTGNGATAGSQSGFEGNDDRWLDGAWGPSISQGGADWWPQAQDPGSLRSPAFQAGPSTTTVEPAAPGSVAEGSAIGSAAVAATAATTVVLAAAATSGTAAAALTTTAATTATSTAAVTLAKNALLVNKGQAVTLSSLYTLKSGVTPPPTLVLQAYDRNAYTVAATSGPGSFSFSSQGTTRTVPFSGEYATLIFNYSSSLSQYVLASANGVNYASLNIPASAITFNASADQYRSTYLSLYTSSVASPAIPNPAQYGPLAFNLGSQLTAVGDIDLAVNQGFTNPVANAPTGQATPNGVAAVAQSFVGKAWNDVGCWVLASNISCAAGASLSVTSGWVGGGSVTNTEWFTAYNSGSTVFVGSQNSTWESQVRAGDMVGLQWSYNGQSSGHIFTISSGSGTSAMVVDNAANGRNSANDGSASDIIILAPHSLSAQWQSITVQNVVVYRLDTPTISVTNASTTVGGTISLGSLATATDAAGKGIAQWQFYDTGVGGAAGKFIVNGSQLSATSAASAVTLAAANLSGVSFLAGSVSGADTIQIRAANVAGYWGDWQALTVTTTAPPAPTVAATGGSVHGGKTLALSTTLTTTAPSGAAVAYYSFSDPSGGGTIQLNGATNLLGATGTSAGNYQIAAADLAKVTYLGGATVGAEALSVSVSSDGKTWSTSASDTLTTIGATVVGKAGTVVTGKTIALASLFSASEPDATVIQQYKIVDPSGTGSIQLNGAINQLGAAGTSAGNYQIAAADLAKVTYLAGATAGSESLTISAFDGAWSTAATAALTVTPPPQPTVSASGASVHGGKTVALSTTFTAAAPSGATVAYYSFSDPSGGGTIQLNGVTNLLGASGTSAGNYQIAAADLAKVTYLGGSTVGTETLSIAASTDGKNWSTAASDTLKTIGATVVGKAGTVVAGKTIALSSLFTASEPDATVIQQYKIVDPSGTGTIQLNGAINQLGAAGTSAGNYQIAAADLAKVTYLAGASAGSESLTISAFDGAWSTAATAALAVTPPPQPTVSASGASVHGGKTVALSTTFTATPSSGTTVASYLVTDPSGGGSIQLNGVTNQLGAAGTSAGMYQIAAADLAKVTYLGGSTVGTEIVSIAASTDGKNWSSLASDTLKTIGATVTTTSQTVATGKTIALSSLFTASEPDATVIQQYKIVDPSGSGTIQLNGAINQLGAAGTSAGNYQIAAADLAKVTYLAGASAGSESLTISAFDGAWSSAATATVTSQTPVAPSVAVASAALAPGASVAAGSLFLVGANSSPASYTLTDLTTAAGAGSFWLNGKQVANGTATTVSAANLSSLVYKAGSSAGSDQIRVQVTDANNATAVATGTVSAIAGGSNSAADNAAGGARSLGTLGSTLLVAQDWVGSSDYQDLYKFVVTTAGSIALSLNGMTADADLGLYNSQGVLLAASINYGTANESLIGTIGQGTYYLGVFSHSGNTAYNLTANNTQNPTTAITAASATAPGTYGAPGATSTKSFDLPLAAGALSVGEGGPAEGETAAGAAPANSFTALSSAVMAQSVSYLDSTGLGDSAAVGLSANQNKSLPSLLASHA